VFVAAGSGMITVNNKDYKNYFPIDFLQLVLTEPLRILGIEDKYDIKINVNGGGIKGQAEACRLGIARALVKDNPTEVTVERNGQEVQLNEVKMKLKAGNRDILTRDARKVERKKPGLLKARRAKQFSKR